MDQGQVQDKIVEKNQNQNNKHKQKKEITPIPDKLDFVNNLCNKFLKKLLKIVLESSPEEINQFIIQLIEYGQKNPNYTFLNYNQYLEQFQIDEQLHHFKNNTLFILEALNQREQTNFLKMLLSLFLQFIGKNNLIYSSDQKKSLKLFYLKQTKDVKIKLLEIFQLQDQFDIAEIDEMIQKELAFLISKIEEFKNQSKNQGNQLNDQADPNKQKEKKQRVELNIQEFDYSFKLIKDFHLIDQYFGKLINIMNINDLVKRAADFIKEVEQQSQNKINRDQFPQIKIRLTKNYVRYAKRQYPWQAAEEILSQQPKLLAYFVEDLLFEKNLPNSKQIAYSISERHQLLEKQLIDKEDSLNQLKQMKEEKTELIENELLVNDKYIPTSEIIFKEFGTYLRLAELGFQDNQIKFIDKEGLELDQAIEDILNSEISGIDSEFRGPITKLDYESVQVAILQISTPHFAYIFDAVALQKNEKFIKFLKDYLTSKKIKKVGHTVGGDFDLINSTFGLGNLKVENIYDIRDEYYKKTKKSEDKCKGLQHIVNTLLKKQLCKLDQCSNWEKRPLRKAQMHYAALDAVSCAKIFELL